MPVREGGEDQDAHLLSVDLHKKRILPLMTASSQFSQKLHDLPKTREYLPHVLPFYFLEYENNHP